VHRMPKYTLGDVSKEVRETFKGDKTGKPIVGLEHLTPSEVTLSAWDLDTDNTFTKSFESGDMLFGRRRAYLKKAAVAPFDGICSGDITVIRANPERLSPDLLPFLIQNDYLFDYAVEKSAGSLSPRVKWEHLKAYGILLPDLEEQQKTAEVLWAIEETCQSYKKLLVETDELIKAQFSEMFGNEKNIVPLKECGTIVTGGTPPKKNHAYYSSNDIHFYKPNDCPDEYVKYLSESEEFISDEARAVADIFQAGTVLVTCIGTIGKIGILTEEGTCNQQINAIIPNEKCISEYIANAIWVKKNELVRRANVTTVTIINKTSFSAFEIPLPDIEEQKRFVKLVQQSNKSKAALQQSLKEARALQKKIVEDNFIVQGKED
jgi:type I restriction enzyme S subunit